MEVRFLRILLALTLLIVSHPCSSLEDLIAEESESRPRVSQWQSKANTTAPTKKYSSRIRASDSVFGLKTSPKKSVLDFRIEPESLRASAAGNGKGKEDDDDEKTLSQQVADGKYGLIQNELFPNGSKRPGIISYLPNPEVPTDTKEDYGGLDKDEIWLAEDHVLVLRGGRFPQQSKDSAQTPWPPIDDYIAPTRQVEIPKNPRIPPPFPVQLTEGGPLEFIRGENGSLPPRPPFFPPFPLPPPGENSTFPFPVPPGPLPPFLANLPPGAAFLPPPGNLTDFDEDDPSIYYPPRYDFYYPQDNTTAVPPGPLVPGIVLPPPPNFFSPEKPDDEENETDPEDNTTRPPYIGPAYLPSDRKPTKPRTYTKRPPIDKKTTVTIVYPERSRPKSTKSPGFTSPIYVPNTGPQHNYNSFPSTTPRPNHISIPRNQSLRQDIYIISTEPPEQENIVDFFKDIKPIKATTLENISPEIHPLRSLIRPNVSVSYIGKVGHLPPSTPFPFPRTESTTETSGPLDVPGHFITLPPTVTVSEVPVVKKIRVRPTETATKNPHATIYFYEETPSTQGTPEENEVSASPIDQFLKENFKPHGPDFELQPVKTPLYLSPKAKTRIQTRPTIALPSQSSGGDFENAGYSYQQKKYKSTTPATVIVLPSHQSDFQNPDYSYQQKKYKSTTPRTVVVLPSQTSDGGLDFANPSYSHQEKFKSTTPSTVIIKKKPTTIAPQTSTPAYDGPFIPSNYYATAIPDNVHFTPLDPSLVDDITMKYFTIFGQKLNALGSTTPLTPVPPTASTPLTTLFSTTEAPRYVTVTTPTPPPVRTPQYVEITTPSKPKHRQPSHFEQYLTEITGEDQKDYISQNVGFVEKPKKGKARPGFNDNPYYIPYRAAEISQYLENIYRPHHSTTPRPILEVAHYQPQISSTYRPYVNNVQRAPKPSSHNFGQFLQEVTYKGPQYTGPKGPATSNLQFFDASSYSSVRQQYQPLKAKPVSLHNDVLVNYRDPLPPINPDAELVQPSYDNTNSNIKVVQAPDLSNNRNRQSYIPVYQPPRKSQPQQLYEPSSKSFFGSLPHSGYFAPQQSSSGNAFVSYNLPGNSGHFYFLTPQAVERSDSLDEPNEEGSDYGAVKRSYDPSELQRRGKGRGEQRLTNVQHHSGTGSTSQDYLRRRRKKP